MWKLMKPVWIYRIYVKSRFNRTCVEWLKTEGIISVTVSGTTGNVRSLNLHGKRACFCLTLIPVTFNKDLDLCKYDTVTKFSLYAAWPSQNVLSFLLSGMFLAPYVRKQISKFQYQLICTYEGELHENLKLHVASGATIFAPLLRRRVAFLHRTATCRPLFKPWVSLFSTYRQSSCVSNFYRTFKVFIWFSLVIKYLLINIPYDSENIETSESEETRIAW